MVSLSNHAVSAVGVGVFTRSEAALRLPLR